MAGESRQVCPSCDCAGSEVTERNGDPTTLIQQAAIPGGWKGFALSWINTFPF